MTKSNETERMEESEETHSSDIRSASESDHASGSDHTESADEIPTADAEQGELEQLEKLKDDLARERAAFHNFRMARAKQAEIEKDRTRSEVIRVILPVLDDFARIERHSTLDDPFKAVVTKLRSAMEKIGLTAFGNPGDPFNPELHEALFQNPSPDVQTETVQDVIEAGYCLGETVIRAAKVVVQVPNG
ncbi:MAG: nucleotide exchange factor GrpE [Tropheryma whipplei]|nr:nucleotide exchange factor GrpE [Tropheryma whipplei]